MENFTEEMNREVKEMIALGLLDENWNKGLGREEAEIRFKQVLSNDQAEPFDDEEMNRKVRDMIKLGFIDRNWARGLNRTEAELKFYQILSNDATSQEKGPEIFDDEDMNQEVRDMIKLGLIDRNWARGLNKTEAEFKFYQILSNDATSQDQGTEIFDDEDMNQEVRDMIKLGLIDRNWARGLNKTEAELKFHQILSNDASLQQKGTELKTSQVSGCVASGSHTQDSRPPLKKGNSVPKKNYKLIPLRHDDEIFKDIIADFKRCGIERGIAAIQRVENENQENLFKMESNQLETLHANDETAYDLNLKDLYHASNAARNLICSRGLDIRLSQTGVFGKGIYFSDNVKKCEKYLLKKKGSAIYKCSVILGDMMEYPDKEPHPELKQEPEKEDGDFYESVKGNVDGFNEFVVFENRRCLIKYRIVLEGTEDEDIDEEVVNAMEASKALEDETFETWKRHIHYLVTHCKHEDEEDEEAELEIRNIEEIRLQIRRRREMQSDLPLTEVTYDLLREERKAWKKVVNRGAKNSKTPSRKEPDDKELTTKQPIIPVPVVLDVSDVSDIQVETEHDPLQQVFDVTMSQFLELTKCEDMELARLIIENQEWDLHRSVNSYYTMMQ